MQVSKVAMLWVQKAWAGMAAVCEPWVHCVEGKAAMRRKCGGEASGEEFPLLQRGAIIFPVFFF